MDLCQYKYPARNWEPGQKHKGIPWPEDVDDSEEEAQDNTGPSHSQPPAPGPSHEVTSPKVKVQHPSRPRYGKPEPPLALPGQIGPLLPSMDSLEAGVAQLMRARSEHLIKKYNAGHDVSFSLF